MTEATEPAFVSHATFDEYAGDYEQALNKGVSLSGESPAYFSEKRIEYTALWLHALGVPAPRCIVDFGCGVGNSTPHFRRHFPQAELLGLDVSAASIERARGVHGDASKFLLLDEARGAGERDLVYCNGVFHHIVPRHRGEWASRVHEMLMPGGLFAVWENNPWNPGTRMVMRRIPFDRDAIPLAAGEARAMLVRSGFEIVGTRFRFYFPKILSAFRPLERFGERVPLGAQYCVLARKPANQIPQDDGRSRSAD
ncbi:MAG TPA: class I SAM-dependent methyltransferase [Blastocatellia bacterium]|nr:class I SAM-dependent methyltransferase [Blastocatellia bacterium]